VKKKAFVIILGHGREKDKALLQTRTHTLAARPLLLLVPSFGLIKAHSQTASALCWPAKEIPSGVQFAD
jgi:hypothetical protein